MDFPMTTIAGYEISRLVCGSNCFLGFSHFSAGRDRWLRQYFTVDRIVEVMAKCAEMGLNAIVAPADAKIADALKMLESKAGKKWIWISTTYGNPSFEKQEEEIRWLGEQKAEFCLVHCGYVDPHLITAEKKVIGLEKLLGIIRDFGMIPGISTHRPETLGACEAAGYDIEAYILPNNVIGFFSNVETNWVSRIIKETPKPVISIKPLASGRLMPYEGLNYVYSAIKPVDTVAIGVMSVQEAEEDIKIARQILTGKEEKIELLETPSKSTVKTE